MRKFLYILILALVFPGAAKEAVAEDAGLAGYRSRWDASWIEVEGAPKSGYAVCYFRKSFELEAVPDAFKIHVSADPRYKLYVNGKLASWGPASGDYLNWNYETVDIAPRLKPGKNVVAAIVWNGGEHRAEAYISHRTAFIVQGVGELAAVVNTGESWQGVLGEAYSPVVGIGYSAYYVAGPGEEVDLAKRPNGWETRDFDDHAWPAANVVGIGWPPRGNPKGVRDAAGWMLVPRSIPQMERTEQQFASVRRAEGVADGEGFSWTIPANSKATLLLDQGHLTNAYPVFEFSGGKGARTQLTYAESLFEEIPQWKSPVKGNRDEVVGKTILGRRDILHTNGSSDQRFETLSWRTFRYVQVEVETKADPLRIEKAYSVFTGYPFEFEASFESSRPELDRILEVGWRTARLCAVETYMDCPYYEQLQYIGDTRIQALVSLYNSGDDRLLRNALDQMDQSRIAEGVTMSRHPSTTPQIIPTFSLWYIGMLRDYWWYGNGAEFVREKIGGTREILSFFNRYQSEDGTLRRPPYWLFTDWVDNSEGWKSGEAPFGEMGESSVLDLQLLWAYQVAGELEGELGMEAFAELYKERADELAASIRRNYWDAARNVLKDHQDEDSPISQHANALAILTGVVRPEEAKGLASLLLSDETMAPASIYFRYYLHLAMAKAGLADEYVEWLDVWRENLELGLTTWAEKPNVATSRSDCHAWGSSPNIELFRIVLGIDSAAPEFQRVLVKPALGDLTQASGSIPHPNGAVRAAYRKTGDTWRIEIELPDGVAGDFVWEERSYPLKAGENSFTL